MSKTLDETLEDLYNDGYEDDGSLREHTDRAKQATSNGSQMRWWVKVRTAINLTKSLKL